MLFLAPSGTGKSTHAAIWREYFGEKVTMINDDKPLVSVKSDAGDTHIRVYGTPWCGKHGIENNISAPVSAVFLLKRGTNNVAKSLDLKSAFPYILNQIYRPRDERLMRKTLIIAGKLAKNVNIFEIKCNMENLASILIMSILDTSCTAIYHDGLNLHLLCLLPRQAISVSWDH